MNRINFLRTAGTLLTTPLLPNQTSIITKRYQNNTFQIPPYLQPGDLIGITSPAGFITAAAIAPAIEIMKSWGYQIKFGNTIGKRDCTFGGTDEERAADFQQMIDDPQIKAVMCARGGYGSVRMIDAIQWDYFKKHPKWIIGFSDITVMHSHIHNCCATASLHSKMCNSFPDNWPEAQPIQVQTISSIHDALAGGKMKYTAVPHPQNKGGSAEGILIGGNLSVLVTLSGTASDINTDGKILFIEDTGEYLYSIDRLFRNLKRSGKLTHLKGLIVGGFNVKPDDDGEPFGRTVMDIVVALVKEYPYPVCFNFPVGHQRANFALKCGVKHQLVVTEDETILSEL